MHRKPWSVPDYSLIADTALEHNLALLTANTKHFAAIEGIRIERFEPGG